MSECLHIIIQKHHSYRSARCLDFTLYSVGETAQEARTKLKDQLDEYLYDAIEGVDKEFAAQLLLRKAPWQDWVTFYFVAFLQRCSIFKNRLGETFKTAIPQGPYRHA